MGHSGLFIGAAAFLRRLVALSATSTTTDACAASQPKISEPSRSGTEVKVLPLYQCTNADHDSFSWIEGH